MPLQKPGPGAWVVVVVVEEVVPVPGFEVVVEGCGGNSDGTDRIWIIIIEYVTEGLELILSINTDH